jgi:hypothetical protein
MRIRFTGELAFAIGNIVFWTISALPEYGWRGSLSAFITVGLATVLGYFVGSRETGKPAGELTAAQILAFMRSRTPAEKAAAVAKAGKRAMEGKHRA